jgi:exosortase
MIAGNQVAMPGNQTAGAAGGALVKLSVLAALLLACYFPMLLMTGRTVLFGDDMAHGLFAPIVALYIAWERRDLLLKPAAPSIWSLPLLAAAGVLGLVSTLAMSSTFSRFAFLISLAGCLLLVGGRVALRRLLFPLGLLLFTFPIPDVFYGQITQPLQLLATRLSESMLELCGYSVLRDGNILQLTHMSLSVVEACSGLRSLITLSFFCLVYSYFFEQRYWMRAGVTLLAIPAAILVNGLRITATGALGQHDPVWAKGTYHESIGWVAFFVGAALVLLAHRLALRFWPPTAPEPAR